ncbi:MAG: hypothetical protein EBV74_06770 [Alphaproteobacteria bacterium]|nr:hypothetical protein [Candidatus Fonsibacter sp. PEL55]
MNVISPTYNGKIDSSLLSKSVKLSDTQGARVISPIDGKIEDFTNTEIEVVGNIDGIEYKVKFENLGKLFVKFLSTSRLFTSPM